MATFYFNTFENMCIHRTAMPIVENLIETQRIADLWISDWCLSSHFAILQCVGIAIQLNCVVQLNWTSNELPNALELQFNWTWITIQIQFICLVKTKTKFIQNSAQLNCLFQYNNITHLYKSHWNADCRNSDLDAITMGERLLLLLGRAHEYIPCYFNTFERICVSCAANCNAREQCPRTDLGAMHCRLSNLRLALYDATLTW